MRKLFVGVLIAIFGLMVIAGTTDIQANWTIKWMKFIFVLDEKGIDLKQSAKYLVTWNLGDSSKNGKVTASFSWGFNGYKWYYSLDSITFDGSLVEISYNNGGTFLDKYFYFPEANDYISLNLKALSNLTLYYFDLFEETNVDSTENELAKSFFDDAVVVKYAQELGVLNLKTFAGFYDAEATNTNDSNEYEFAGVVYLNGSDSLKGLSVEISGANLASGDTAYGVYASYSLEMGSIKITPVFKYTENLEKIKFVNTVDKAWWYPYVKDEKKVGLSADFKMDPVSFGVNVTYYLDKESMPVGLNAGFNSGMISANANFSIWNAKNFDEGWVLKTDAGISFDPISVDAKFWYNHNYPWYGSAETAYSATLSYTIEEGLKAKVFYGTLYDSDGDGYLDMNPDYPQWWLKICYSL